jgi:hypothetical protein
VVKGPYVGAVFNLTLAISRLRSQLSTTITKGKGRERKVVHNCICLLIMEQPIGKGRVRGRGREGVEAYFMS